MKGCLQFRYMLWGINVSTVKCKALLLLQNVEYMVNTLIGWLVFLISQWGFHLQMYYQKYICEQCQWLPLVTHFMAYWQTLTQQATLI